jgi:RNA polymerase sigma-70 factor (ECF subfamily)
LSSSEWFDAAFRAHYARVVRTLGRLTGDRGQAEEIAADVFCKLALQPAINAGLDAVRSNSLRKRREERATAASSNTAEPEALERLLTEERRERVQRVLAALKPRDAQMLLLRSSGMSYRELAETLGIQLGSVGSMLARAEQEFERRYRARYRGRL